MNPNNSEEATITTGGSTARVVRPGVIGWAPSYSDLQPISFSPPIDPFADSVSEEGVQRQDEMRALRAEGMPEQLIREILMERMQEEREAIMLRSPRLRINHSQENMSEVEEVLKVRHLNRSERQQMHRPLPDWKESTKGDVCKNACTLEVEDIIGKHLVNA